MNKIKFYDKRILKKACDFFLVEGTILGIVALFKQNIIEENAKSVLIIYITLLIGYYLIIFMKANLIKKIVLKVHNSTFEIKTGDIFKQNALKVINFNEYFDTLVDNKVIAKNSLNGIFILNHVNDIQALDKHINEALKDENQEKNDIRKIGKQIKYPLGTIVEYNDYLLTALTKFSDDDRANLYLYQSKT